MQTTKHDVFLFCSRQHEIYVPFNEKLGSLSTKRPRNEDYLRIIFWIEPMGYLVITSKFTNINQVDKISENCLLSPTRPNEKLWTKAERPSLEMRKPIGNNNNLHSFMNEDEIYVASEEEDISQHSEQTNKKKLVRDYVGV
jgi:hypothetical protein